MKFCTKCGAETADEAVVCTKCGCAFEADVSKPAAETGAENTSKVGGADIATFIFMILKCVLAGWSLIPLCWMIPMTVVCWNKMKKGERIGTGFKVCTLLFFDFIAGILLFCRKEPNE